MPRRAAGIPAAISFTVETDGRLPTGQPLREAIEQVDAATDARAAYFMVNCAHPDALSPMRWTAMGRGGERLRRLARERIRRRATPSSTRRPSSTRAIRSSSAPEHAALRDRLPQSRCSAAAAARTPGTWRRSSRPGTRLGPRCKNYRFGTAQSSTVSPMCDRALASYRPDT